MSEVKDTLENQLKNLKEQSKAEEKPKEEPTTTTTEKPTEETEKKEENVTKTENKTTTVNETVSTEGKKKVTEKVVLTKVEEFKDVAPLSEEQFKTSQKKIDAIDEFDRLKQQKEKARNVLESFVLEIQEKLSTPEYEKLSTDEERENLLKACSEVSDWLYEDGSDSEKETYDAKLKELKKMFKPISDRVKESQERPEVLASLMSMLNMSTVFLEKAKGMDYFTDVELSVLQKLIEDTVKWKKEKVAEQSKIHFTAPSKLTTRMVVEKIEALDREVKYLVNKARVNKMKSESEKAAESDPTKDKTGETKDNKDSPEEKAEKKEKGDSLFDKRNKDTTDSKVPDEEKHSEL